MAKLSTRDPSEKPRPAIVTTGTKSGKTECFLFPILDHCLWAKRAGQKGIKAIILYPMNALASDQEKRFAKTVHEFAELREAGIRVGNYTGRYDPADPPDILLTNYKMLDYLLIRPQDQRLWRFNGDESGESSDESQTGKRVAKWKQPLQYLVLDELHTFARFMNDQSFQNLVATWLVSEVYKKLQRSGSSDLPNSPGS